MATPEELIKQYEEDPKLKEEVDKILEDGKITPMEFLGFAKKHDLRISLSELPKIVEEAKKAGLLK